MRIKSGIFHLWDFVPWCQYLINRKLAERHTVNRDQFMVGILCRLCGFRGQGNQERKGSEKNTSAAEAHCSRARNCPCMVVHRHGPSVP